jgi:hypothetical protein
LLPEASGFVGRCFQNMLLEVFVDVVRRDGREVGRCCVKATRPDTATILWQLTPIHESIHSGLSGGEGMLHGCIQPRAHAFIVAHCESSSLLLELLHHHNDRRSREDRLGDPAEINRSSALSRGWPSKRRLATPFLISSAPVSGSRRWRIHQLRSVWLSR